MFTFTQNWNYIVNIDNSLFKKQFNINDELYFDKSIIND